MFHAVRNKRRQTSRVGGIIEKTNYECKVINSHAADLSNEPTRGHHVADRYGNLKNIVLKSQLPRYSWVWEKSENYALISKHAALWVHYNIYSWNWLSSE